MLVTLEGLDGSGKTTVVRALRDADVLADATFTREPTESWYGDAVARSIADADADPLAELFLYTADHAAHLASTIQPALDRGEIVVSDRYADSRYAYQGATLAERFADPVAFVKDIHQPWTRPPDLTIYLDVDPDTAATRSGGETKFEQSGYLARVRDNYERLIADEPDRFVRIDATTDADVVVREAREAIEAAL